MYMISICMEQSRLTPCSWFVLGQLFASVALNRLNASQPYDFKTPIYTQVSRPAAAVKCRNYVPEYCFNIASSGA